MTEGEHYFTRRPTSSDGRTDFTVEGPWGRLELGASPGVFSSRGLDRGTRVLLDHFRRSGSPSPPPGSHLLDLGCGSGALSLVLASWLPGCSVHGIDVNDRALALCAENARRNALSNLVCHRPDEVDPALRFHVIWSNPPIRIGKQDLHALLSTWLARLHPEGTATLVVARHLGADSLSNWLTGQGLGVARLGSSQGFRLLRVTPATQ